MFGLEPHVLLLLGVCLLAAMQAQGHVFYLAANGVWLSDAVPAAFITFI